MGSRSAQAIDAQGPTGESSVSTLRAVMERLRVFVTRIPKNLSSNRFWIVWGGALYVFSPRARVSLVPEGPRAASNWVRDARHYVRWTRFFRMTPFPPATVGLFLTELGMFGNMSRRLANGLSLVFAHRIGALIAPRKVIFHGNIFREGHHQLKEPTTFHLGEEPHRKKNPTCVLVHGELLGDRGLQDLGLHGAIDEAWASLTGLLLTPNQDTELAPHHLVIHVRGGDVFGPRKPRTYGQPPLSFYELVINAEPWSEVTIVHQDLLNPVITPLIELCTQRGITVRSHSGTILEDIQMLMSGHTLVAGRGTFIPAIAGLSRRCGRVYFFEDKCSLVPRRSGIEMVRVRDKDHGFADAVLANNWQNTPEQRELMLSYPASSLVMESPDPGTSH